MRSFPEFDSNDGSTRSAIAVTEAGSVALYHQLMSMEQMENSKESGNPPAFLVCTIPSDSFNLALQLLVQMKKIQVPVAPHSRVMRLESNEEYLQRITVKCREELHKQVESKEITLKKGHAKFEQINNIFMQLRDCEILHLSSVLQIGPQHPAEKWFV